MGDIGEPDMAPTGPDPDSTPSQRRWGRASLRVDILAAISGAFTTFSTFAFETVRLAEEGAGREALYNIAANAVVGTVVGGLGLAVAIH